MSTPERVTHRELRELLRSFHESGWNAMTLDVDGIRVTVGKDGPPSAVAAGRDASGSSATAPEAAPARTLPPAPQGPATAPTKSTAPTTPAAEPVDAAGCVEIRSPAVGSFWVAPSPGEPPFVQVGDTVDNAQQLGIVEVMKLMNPVVAPQPGEIVRVFVADAALVEYDQPLFLLRPTDG
ncbi:acetyl-CoA carboxylase biotin carboxyl carrier protein [Nocardia callitridis]|uniref:Biotin carboxyl carrier protein of acetyl-CoA carboxylase n=1 Tax=Nocardia callitridis TaxID=648753 RepID=A0ABP9K4F5_9NOCA